MAAPVGRSGDYKAMNVFVSVGQSAEVETGAALIDFQWTGVGLGMLDVAMHLYHSVELSAMEGGGAYLHTGPIIHIISPRNCSLNYCGVLFRRGETTAVLSRATVIASQRC
jgi:hypothetical protein